LRRWRPSRLRDHVAGDVPDDPFAVAADTERSGS
jgi:hypothetical protein